MGSHLMGTTMASVDPCCLRCTFRPIHGEEEDLMRSEWMLIWMLSSSRWMTELERGFDELTM